jgi:amidase
VDSIASLLDALEAGRVTAVQLAGDAIERLGEARTAFGAVAAIEPDLTLADARASDERRAEGATGALEGIPITVKDWIDVAGWPITGSAVAHRDREPAEDATAVARLRNSGAVVAGITTALADSPAHGRTGNPHDLSRAPGGSSSGAAAVVAAGASPLALGSDSGGSIRLPSAWCGASGLKPTFGRVPLTGHFPRLGSLSDARTVIGPIASCVDDLSTVLPIIAGPDGKDAGVAPVPLGDPAAIDVGTVRIGLVVGVDDDHVTAAATSLRASGSTVIAEAFPDVRDDALEITRRYWNRAALHGRDHEALLWDWDRFRRRIAQAMQRYDALLMPAVTEAAPPWRESIDTDYVWQLPWSLTGSPAVVVPVGSTGELPLSVQVVARPWEDHVALAVAGRIEASLGGSSR